MLYKTWKRVRNDEVFILVVFDLKRNCSHRCIRNTGVVGANQRFSKGKSSRSNIERRTEEQACAYLPQIS